MPQPLDPSVYNMELHTSSYWKSATNRPTWRLRSCKSQDTDDTLAYTMDEAMDLEVLTYMALETEECSDEEYEYATAATVSGLPLVCSNCGVSFFSLQIPDDQMDCYCSGECKWSVIMYREMDLRLFTRRNKCTLDSVGCLSLRASMETATATDTRRAVACSAVDTFTGTGSTRGSGVFRI